MLLKQRTRLKEQLENSKLGFYSQRSGPKSYRTLRPSTAKSEKQGFIFQFNNVIAESKEPIQVENNVIYIEGGFVKPEVVEFEIQTDDLDEYGLLKIGEGRKIRKLDEVIPEDSSESAEQEYKESDVQELKRLQKRLKGKKRGQATKSFYFQQIDAGSAPNMSDNLSAINDPQT